MKLDLQRFFHSCNPSRTLVLENPQDRQYYIDFASVRGGKVIEALGRTITRLSPNKPTCQLFTGHLGCGKSTELRRLEAELKQQGFHVVYFESTQDLDMADVDITDIMLAITGQVSASLEAIGIRLRPGYFANLFGEVKDFLQIPIDSVVQGELSLVIAKITAKTKDSPTLRSQLRREHPTFAKISNGQETIEVGTPELKRLADVFWFPLSTGNFQASVNLLDC